MATTSDLIDANLERLIKESYLIVLGLGFTFIVRDLLLGGYGPVAIAAKLVYFLGLYYFLTYDWIAYAVLIDAYPYSMGDDPRLTYQGRFYADLTHLLLKAALIFLALRTPDFGTLALACVLFAGWHVTIMGWHLFAQYEYEGYDVNWESHVFMAALYLILVVVMRAVEVFLGSPLEPVVLVCLLMGVVVVYATRRKRTLIERPRLEVHGTSAS